MTPQRGFKKLTDRDPMPFGPFKGMELINVPAEYLLGLLGKDWIERHVELKEYIQRNRHVLDGEVINSNRKEAGNVGTEQEAGRNDSYRK